MVVLFDETLFGDWNMYFSLYNSTTHVSFLGPLLFHGRTQCPDSGADYLRMSPILRHINGTLDVAGFGLGLSEHGSSR